MSVTRTSNSTRSAIFPTHVPGGHVNVAAPKRPVQAVLKPGAVPQAIDAHYDLSLSPDRRTLTVDPAAFRRAATRALGSSGFVATDTAMGGKAIVLEGGPFSKGAWIASTFRALVKDPKQLAKLVKADYDVDSRREFLVVNGQKDKAPTVFAFSRDPDHKGIVSVCSEVTVLDFARQGGGPVLIRKPVVYLYPTKKTLTTVKVEPDGEFRVQYPKAVAGKWEVVATPDGTLFDPATERKFGYLYWEAASPKRPTLDRNRAYCVPRAEVETFLEVVCNKYALTFRERTDFVSYWLAHMEKNPYTLVQFLDEAEYEAMAKLTITPMPDTCIRMFMLFEGVPAPVPVGKPDMPVRLRQGFTVVEWGGCNLDEAV